MWAHIYNIYIYIIIYIYKNTMFWYLVEQVDIGYLGTMSPTISIPSGNSWKNIWLWHALALDQDPTKIAGISVDILWMWYIWMYLIGFCGAPVSFSRFFLCFSMFFLCSYNEMWVFHPVSSIFRAKTATWVTVPESSKSARRSSAPQPVARS